MNAQTQAEPLRRVGIIGDVHTENDALTVTLSFLRGIPDVSAILCSGDLVTGIGDADAVITLLRDADACVVRGNHDHWFGNDFYLGMPHATFNELVEKPNRAYLSGLPPTQTFATVSGSLLLCHGMGDDDMAGVHPGGEDYEIAWMLHKKEVAHFRYIVAGHTHTRMVRPVAHSNGDVTTIINAGTLKSGRTPGFLVVDFTAQTATAFQIVRDTVTEGRTVSLRLPGEENA